MGLREQIKNATSDTQIAELLNTGKKYEWASARTQRSWKSTARFQLALLNSNDSAQPAEIPAGKSEVSKKKFKKK